MANVNVTVKLIPHPDPDRIVDVMARLILNEILHREKEERDGKNEVMPHK